MKATIMFAFILLLVLMLLAYNVGVKTDSAALSSGIAQTAYAFTGRNTSGNFVNYPK